MELYGYASDDKNYMCILQDMQLDYFFDTWMMGQSLVTVLVVSGSFASGTIPLGRAGMHTQTYMYMIYLYTYI